jgi:hypothetical protein
MVEIANAVGRAMCLVIGGFVHECQTGQSVADIGYWTMAIIVLFFGVMAFLTWNAE